MKLREAVEFCFTHREAWKTGNGAETARINSNHVCRILGENIEVEEIGSKHFALITETLLKEGKAKATVNRITAALHTVIEELRCHGYKLDEVKFKRQKEKQGRPGFYTEEEVDAMLAKAAELDDYMLLHDSILFAVKTGCRQGEMLDLKAEDIDLESGEMIFRDTKNGSDHWLKIHPDLVPALERRLEYRVGEVLFFWSNKDQLLRVFKRLKASIGMTDRRGWHTLRHSVATWLCERNVPMRAVMGVLNHKDLRTTLRYAKASDRSVAAAIDLL